MNVFEQALNERIEEIVDAIVTKKLDEFKESQEFERREKRMARGIGELASYLGRSLPTIHRWKKDGTLKGTYFQTGRCIIFDLDKVDSKFCK